MDSVVLFWVIRQLVCAGITYIFVLIYAYNNGDPIIIINNPLFYHSPVGGLTQLAIALQMANAI
jgi:hypothetical protein